MEIKNEEELRAFAAPYHQNLEVVESRSFPRWSIYTLGGGFQTCSRPGSEM